MPLTHVEDRDPLVLTWRLDVGRERVWRCLTQPDLLAHWLGELVDGAVAEGGGFTVDHGGGYLCRSRVTTCQGPTAITVTWEFPDEPASAVALELGAEEDGTTLRLTHSGLGDLAPSYRTGWCVHLTYLEAATMGEPLPPATFWPLHATLTRLAPG